MAPASDTTREAVARAIYDADNGMDGDTFAEVIGDYIDFDGSVEEYRARVMDVCLHLADRALAALRPAQDAEGWRDIASAPKDYTHVIGMDAKGIVAATWFFAPSSQTRNWLKVGRNGKWKPIYWMPLPSPPRALEGK